MALKVRVSGQAEFSQIKREVKGLDGNLKQLQKSVQQGIGQGFFNQGQSRLVQHFMNQLEEGQRNINSLLDEERTKIDDIQRRWRNASGDRRRQLRDELEQRQQIVNTYEQELNAIRRQQQSLQNSTQGINVQGNGGGQGGGPDMGGGILSSLLGVGKKALGMMGIVGGLGVLKSSIDKAGERQKAVSKLTMRIGGGFSNNRRDIRDTGLENGYNALESMQFVDTYTSRAGHMTRDDQGALQDFSRGFGLEANQVASTFGEFRRLGASNIGGQREFANMIANSIDRGNMQERAVEAMESTAGLMGELAQNLPEVTGAGVVALQTLMNQTGVEGFRGERGADFISKLNSMFTTGEEATSFFTMKALGYGTDKDWYEATLQREKGISDPENLASVMRYIKMSYSSDPRMQDMALSRMGNMSLTEAKAFREETHGYTDTSKEKIEAIQKDLKASGTIEEKASTWQDSIGGWITTIDAKLEEALATFGNGMLKDFYLMKSATASMLNMFNALLGSDNDDNGLIPGAPGSGNSGFITPTTAVVGAGAIGLTIGGVKFAKNIGSRLINRGGREALEHGDDALRLMQNAQLGDDVAEGFLPKIGGKIRHGADWFMSKTRGFGRHVEDAFPRVGGAVRRTLPYADEALEGIGKFAGKFAKAMPFVGGMIDFGFNKMDGDSTSKAVVKAIGSTIGSALGLVATGALGLGTGGAGLVAGGTLTVGGAVAGEKIAETAYDKIASWFGLSTEKTEEATRATVKSTDTMASNTETMTHSVLGTQFTWKTESLNIFKELKKETSKINKADVAPSTLYNNFFNPVPPSLFLNKNVAKSNDETDTLEPLKQQLLDELDNLNTFSMLNTEVMKKPTEIVNDLKEETPVNFEDFIIDRPFMETLNTKIVDSVNTANTDIQKSNDESDLVIKGTETKIINSIDSMSSNIQKSLIKETLVENTGTKIVNAVDGMNTDFKSSIKSLETAIVTDKNNLWDFIKSFVSFGFNNENVSMPTTFDGTKNLPNPVPGAKLTDSWGNSRDGGRRKHEGIDIFAPKGTPIYSTTSGTVSKKGEAGIGGKRVGVTDSDGNYHYYAHMNKYSDLKVGDTVRQGDVLGYVGNTGNAKTTPPHLHYGIQDKNGNWANPYDYITNDKNLEQQPTPNIQNTKNLQSIPMNLAQRQQIDINVNVSGNGVNVSQVDELSIKKIVEEAIRSVDWENKLMNASLVQ